MCGNGMYFSLAKTKSTIKIMSSVIILQIIHQGNLHTIFLIAFLISILPFFWKRNKVSKTCCEKK